MLTSIVHVDECRTCGTFLVPGIWKADVVCQPCKNGTRLKAHQTTFVLEVDGDGNEGWKGVNPFASLMPQSLCVGCGVEGSVYGSKVEPYVFTGDNGVPMCGQCREDVGLCDVDVSDSVAIEGVLEEADGFNATLTGVRSTLDALDKKLKTNKHAPPEFHPVGGKLTRAHNKRAAESFAASTARALKPPLVDRCQKCGKGWLEYDDTGVRVSSIYAIQCKTCATMRHG